MPTESLSGREAMGVYLEAFARGAARRRLEPAWLQVARERSVAAFEERGFPTTREEDWRFTNITPIVEGAFPPIDGFRGEITSASAEQYLVAGLAGPALVFVDGHYAPELSRVGTAVNGVTVGSLAALLPERADDLQPVLGRHASVAGRPFAALNTALFEDGAYVRVAPDVIAPEAVQVVFISTGRRPRTSIHPRMLLVAGANSQLRLAEIFAGPEGSRYLTNAVTEIVAADGAVVDYYRIQRESEEAFHIGQTQIRASRSSSVSSHSIAVGGAIARHDVVAVLAGEGADCTLNGLYLAHGHQLVDNHTEIDHATPHGTSHEVYKGILSEHARGVFNGRIKVRVDAQKTDAKQTNKTLLLSGDAQINTKPQLEILANDVKCTHGATVGQLNPEALFYLRSRGIGAEDARSLLIRAFAMDVLSGIRLEPLRAELDRLLAARLPGALAERAFA